MASLKIVYHRYLLFIMILLIAIIPLYLPCARADDNSSSSTNQSNQESISGASFIKAEKVQPLLKEQSLVNTQVTSEKIDIKTKKGSDDRLKDRTSISNTIAGGIKSVKSTNKLVPTTSWRKKTVPVSKSSVPTVKITQSKELQKMEKQRKAMKESFEKKLESSQSRYAQ